MEGSSTEHNQQLEKELTSALDLTPFQVANHGKASATEISRQNRKMQPHMRSQVDEVVFCVDTHVPGPPYCTSLLRAVHAGGAGQLASGPHARYVRRTRASLGRTVRTRQWHVRVRVWHVRANPNSYARRRGRGHG